MSKERFKNHLLRKNVNRVLDPCELIMLGVYPNPENTDERIIIPLDLHDGEMWTKPQVETLIEMLQEAVAVMDAPLISEFRELRKRQSQDEV